MRWSREAERAYILIDADRILERIFVRGRILANLTDGLAKSPKCVLPKELVMSTQVNICECMSVIFSPWD